MVKAGLATVLEKKGTLPTARNHEELLAAQTEAKGRKIGIWSTDEPHRAKHTRQVVYPGDADYNAQNLVEQS